MAIRGLRRLFDLVARPFRGRSAVDAEIGFHLDQQVRDLVEAGWTAEAARAEAGRRFGDLDRYREALVTLDRATAARRGRREWFADLLQDLRFAGRLLGRSPGFTVAVVLTLGLGIGANATMFGLVDRLLFKPPAHVVAPDRVARFVVTESSLDWGSSTNTSVSYLSYQAERHDARRTDGIAAYYTSRMAYDRGENARELRTTLATAAFFPLLGVKPVLGRFYGENDDQVGSAPVAVISERLWRRELGGGTDVLGKALFLGRRLYSIIGVAPAGFTGIDLDAVGAWLPLNVAGSDVWGASDDWRTQDGFQWMSLVARLPEGGDRVGAAAEAAQVYRRAKIAADPSLNKDSYKVTAAYAPVIAARGAAPSKSALVAALLAGVSLLVLLIASANVANLFLARGLSRRREIAVRLALGIRRGRLVRMLVLESVVLCLLGAGLALGVAWTGGGAVRRFLLPQ
ncbi:MAG: ABC transporter permease, partial [Gemmatimonadota bacterium]